METKENEKKIDEKIGVNDLFSLKKEDMIEIDKILNDLIKTNNNNFNFVLAVRNYNWKENYRDAVFFVVGQFLERNEMKERVLKTIKKNANDMFKMLQLNNKQEGENKTNAKAKREIDTTYIR